MSIEEQIRMIAKQELDIQLSDAEKRLRAQSRQENKEILDQIEGITAQLEALNETITDLSSRIEKLEEDLSNRFGLVVKLRKYTLDQLMSEYKRLTGSMRPEQEESAENAEI
jgi:predicted nuclease with TOPRIM domain